MIILGLNAYHGDSSACIVVGGNLVAAVAYIVTMTFCQVY